MAVIVDNADYTAADTAVVGSDTAVADNTAADNTAADTAVVDMKLTVVDYVVPHTVEYAGTVVQYLALVEFLKLTLSCIMG